MKQKMHIVGKWLFVLILSFVGLAVFVSPVFAVPKLNKTAYVIKGQKEQLKIEGTKALVKWQSADKKIASVTQKGIVVGKKKGKVVISAKVAGKILKCKVTVETPRLSKTKAFLALGEELQLKVSGTKQKVKWSCSDKNIAKVDSKGRVTARKIGSVTITASVGKKKYNCKIQVEDPVISSAEEYIYPDEELQLKVSGTDREVKWSSSNRLIVTVDENGLVVPKRKGKVTITAAIGSTKRTCEVFVIDPDTTLNHTEEVLLTEKSFHLSLLPTDYSLQWISSDESVVTVDKDGNVQTIGKGSAVITGSLGEHEYKCSVVVEEPALSENFFLLKTGETAHLEVMGTTKTVKWRDGKCAEFRWVDPDGKKKVTIKATAVGVCSISAWIDYKELTCKVVVVDPDVETWWQYLEIKTRSGKHSIVIDVQNKYKKRIYPTMAVLFYDKNEIVIGAEQCEVSGGIGKGKSNQFYFDKPKGCDHFELIGLYCDPFNTNNSQYQ